MQVVMKETFNKKMFGRGASDAQQYEQRFNTLKQKYQSVLNSAQSAAELQFQNLSRTGR